MGNLKFENGNKAPVNYIFPRKKKHETFSGDVEFIPAFL